jgi:dihydroorotate dehydrogenase (NAD+) catalytic subunit
MSVSTTIDRYDIAQSYAWNYLHAPETAPEVDVPAVPGAWSFCGLPVASPLGMPAGPLLNSRWILYYAALGFDVLTYKTVRSRFRASFDPPNLLPINPGAVLSGEGSEVSEAGAADRIASWAISFGMPSRDPAEWRADVERARLGLRARQVLSVSVVASPEPGWTMAQLADDFAQCAVWAADSGAQVVEANLSCPNVCTQEADLYLSPEAAGEIASTVRARLPRAVPLALKIGLFHNEEQAAAVLRAVNPFAQAVSSTNSITAVVRGRFGGLRRGIGGAATTARCNEELKMLSRLRGESGSSLRFIGVGGVMNAADVRDRLAAGAENVHLATAPMVDPHIGIRIRREMAQS